MTSQGLPLAGESVSLSQEVVGPTFSACPAMPARRRSRWQLHDQDLSPGDYRLLNVRMPATKSGLQDSRCSGLPSRVEFSTASSSDHRWRPRSLGHRDRRERRRPAERPEHACGSACARSTRRFDTTEVGAGAVDNGRVNDDGTFEFKAAIGQVRLLAVRRSDQFVLKSVDAGRRDIVDAAIEIRAGQTLSGIQLVPVDSPDTSCRAPDRRERQSHCRRHSAAFVADTARWGDDSRYVAAGSPDQQGMFGHVGCRRRVFGRGARLRRRRRRERSGVPQEAEERATAATLSEGAPEVVNLVLR